MEKTSVKELRSQFADFCNNLLTYNKSLNQEVSIDGTISSDPRQGNKYIYFTITDNEKSPINVIADSSNMDALFLSVGHRVNVKGRLSIYKQGYLKGFDLIQITATSVSRISNMTEGYSGSLMYVSTCKKVKKTIDYNNKPYMSVAVITSRDGEGMPDVQWALKGCEYFKLNHIPTNMFKSEEIAENISNAKEDIVMIVRGGTTNVSVFDEVKILRAVVNSKKYTICGIGHAQQEPLINKVVDIEQSTPTAAGMYLKNSYSAYRSKILTGKKEQEIKREFKQEFNKKQRVKEKVIFFLIVSLIICLLDFKFKLF